MATGGDVKDCEWLVECAKLTVKLYERGLLNCEKDGYIEGQIDITRALPDLEGHDSLSERRYNSSHNERLLVVSR